MAMKRTNAVAEPRSILAEPHVGAMTMVSELFERNAVQPPAIDLLPEGESDDDMVSATPVDDRPVDQWADIEIAILRDQYARVGPQGLSDAWLPAHSSERIREMAIRLGIETTTTPAQRARRIRAVAPVQPRFRRRISS